MPGENQGRLTQNGTALLNERLPRLVLICGPDDFSSEVQRELRRRGKDLRAAVAQGIASARRSMEDEEIPAVILAEERALVDGVAFLRHRRQALADALSLLAGYAPVVWIGSAEDAAEVSPAIRSAPVDFVPRSALCVTAAVSMVERRLRSSTASMDAGGRKQGIFSLIESPMEGGDFGHVLRHELNNPLTGILGNAELLLLEVRRGRLHLPPHTLQRLEVITELAVRMREAVRQLSDRWEASKGAWSMEKERYPEQTAGS